MVDGMHKTVLSVVGFIVVVMSLKQLGHVYFAICFIIIYLLKCHNFDMYIVYENKGI